MRKLALFVLGFSAAIFLSQYFLSDIYGLALAGAAAVIAFITVFIKRKPAVMTRIIAVGMIIGAVWNFAFGYFYFDHAEALGGYSGEVRAVAADYPVATDYGCKVEIKIQFDSKPAVSAILYSFGDVLDVTPGDMLRFEGELKLASENTENDYFASKGIPLFAYAKSEINLDGRVEHHQLRYFHKIAAKAVKVKIAEIFPEFSKPIAAFRRNSIGGSTADNDRSSRIPAL